MIRPSARLLLATMSWQAACASAPDPVYDAFKTPPPDARPFVRWSWSGGRVQKQELARQLDLLRDAGIGGVEVHPDGMPPGVPEDSYPQHPAHAWLSAEWARLLRTAIDSTQARQMVTDLAVGPGGRLGSASLAEAEQIQRLRVVRLAFEGPLDMDLRVKTLEAELPLGGDVTARRLLFARVAPNQRQQFTPGTDLQPKAGAADTLRLVLPAGKHEVYAGFHEIGFRLLDLGPPGARAPMADQLNAGAVRRSLDEVARALSPALAGRLGDSLRAAVVHPVDLAEANWTPDLAAEFARRRGYELFPYLPYLFNERDGYGDTTFAETIRRARYDFARTTVELFRERFVETYVGWCKEHGLRSRMQGDGRAAYPFAASAGIDLPDGKALLGAAAVAGASVQIGPTLMSQYIASIARLRGGRRTGFETTNAASAFRETLEDFKLALDGSLAAGLAHTVVTGFDYAPAQAPFPGWVTGGVFLHDKNPWWPHFRRWTDYAGRLAVLLREATPVEGQIAMLTGRAEAWARHGLVATPAGNPSRQALADALVATGTAVDFVGEDLVRGAAVDGMRLRIGQRSYDLLLLDEVDAVEPDTAAALVRIASAGGKIAFVGHGPRKSPGLLGAAANDRKVVESMHAIFAMAAPFAAIVERPKKDLVAWTAELHRRFEVKPVTTILTPDKALLHTRGKLGDRELFFFANGSRRDSLSSMVIFGTGKRIPWRWDPETGRRAPLPVGYYPDQVRVHLGPAESMLLVFEEEGGSGTIPARPDPSQTDSFALQPAWTVELQHLYAPRSTTRELPALVDLGQSRDDLALNSFAGTAVYRTKFQANDAVRPLLHLGTVHGTSEVTLNGVHLGVRWYGEHVYDAGPALRVGENELEVKVTTPAANYLRAIGDVNPVARHWTRGAPAARVGLIGPIELRTRRD